MAPLSRHPSPHDSPHGNGPGSAQAADREPLRETGADPGAPGGQQRLATELAAVVGTFMRRLRTASPAGGLTPTQRSVVHRIDDTGPTTIAALARAELVRPQSMRATIGALEEQGVLRRSPHPTDGRQVVFALTEAGVATLDEVRRAKHDWLADALTTRIDAAERRTLDEAVAVLKRLTRE